MHIVIVGGGVIGMMQARELALRGCQVTLIERHECGREASWAGGGIISPLYPWRYSPAVTALANWSQEYYPNLVQSLEAESGIDPEMTRHGMLMLALEDAEQAQGWAEENTRWMETVDADKLYQLEAGLAPGQEGALYMPAVASVRNPRMCQALRRILKQLPSVTLLENTAVREFKFAKGRIRYLVAGNEKIEADKYILTSGAWTGSLLAASGIELPVVPVKGQMVAFQTAPGTVSRVVLSNGRYVIPRRDGLVLAGSTLEYTGFDKSKTDKGRESLVDSARQLIPGLADCPVVEHWAGLRPGSPQGVPFIGAVPGLENGYVNAGQFRNGLVLAPASVRLLASLLLGEAVPFDAGPYQLAGRIRTVSGSATAEAG